MDKPLIRHCRNCKWCQETGFYGLKCIVRYKNIEYPRLKAILCMYYELECAGEDK